MTSENQVPFQWLDGDLQLQLHIQPKAKIHAVSGLHGDRIKLQLAAPPVEGKANTALIDFLAGEFGVPRKGVTLTRGRQSRLKSVIIHDPSILPTWFTDLQQKVSLP